jgi:CheY-like chemotaxis protein
VSPDALRVTVAVEDTGVGMDEDTISRLFQPFCQVDSSTTRMFGGTGLGLTISRKLAKMMGGDVTVVSTPNVGSTFTLTFEAIAAERAAASAHDAKPAPRFTGLHGARILIVDDNPTNREVARLFLRPLRAVLSEAENGRQALEILAGQDVDLVLLDIHMPLMDGPETLARLRASDFPSRNAPVIALTADAMPQDRERFRRLGLNGYIAKPMDQREALAEIARVLGADPTVARDETSPSSTQPTIQPEIAAGALGELRVPTDRAAGA